MFSNCNANTDSEFGCNRDDYFRCTYGNFAVTIYRYADEHTNRYSHIYTHTDAYALASCYFNTWRHSDTSLCTV